jgi:rhamnosyltransferase
MPPKVSIVYLTKNGGENFRDSLNSVFEQEVDFTYEVIAVDSGSSDGTLEILAGHAVRVERIPSGEFNFGLSRDFGFSLGHGEILVSLSQDAVPSDKNWLQRLCAPLANSEVAAVQGEEIPPRNRKPFYWDRMRLFNFTRETIRWMRVHDGIGMSFVNCAVRRSVWAANRLGPIDMSEDKVFQKRISERGYKVVSARNATVFHAHMYDLRALAKRCENEGLGWRQAGCSYSLYDMLLDLFNPLILMVLLYGMITVQIRRCSELLFPWIRPVFVFRGNHLTTRYIK